MNFSQEGGKKLAAGIKALLPTDFPAHVNIEIDIMNQDTSKYMTIIMNGRPPGLTTTVIVEGNSLTYLGIEN